MTPFSLLDIHGPSITVDTACSSGLIALHEGTSLGIPDMGLPCLSNLSCEVFAVRRGGISDRMWRQCSSMVYLPNHIVSNRILTFISGPVPSAS